MGARQDLSEEYAERQRTSRFVAGSVTVQLPTWLKVAVWIVVVELGLLALSAPAIFRLR